SPSTVMTPSSWRRIGADGPRNNLTMGISVMRRGFVRDLRALCGLQTSGPGHMAHHTRTRATRRPFDHQPARQLAGVLVTFGGRVLVGAWSLTIVSSDGHRLAPLILGHVARASQRRVRRAR